MRERGRFEREIADLGLHELPTPGGSGAVSGKKWPRVMFEFDIHFGFLGEVDAQIPQTSPHGGLLTTHSKANDAFDVKRDWNRLEIGSEHLALSSKGKTRIALLKRTLAAFVSKLERGCAAGKTRTDITVSNYGGHPRPFPLPEAVTPILIHKLPAGPRGRKKFPPPCKTGVVCKSCRTWGSPQAHLTIPLESVGALVDRIHASMKLKAGKRLTGGPGGRMGLRSDHLYDAKKSVLALRKRMIAAGGTLSSGTPIDSNSFSERLAGLLILQVSYLWVRDKAQAADTEPFAKGHLPINVKTPFPDIFTGILTQAERDLYSERLAGPTVRDTLFRLVRRSATLADGATPLFPDHAPGLISTWDDLLDLTLGSITVGGLPGGGHIWPLTRTAPRVALELRRIGYTALYADKWDTLIDTIVKLAEDLN